MERRPLEEVEPDKLVRLYDMVNDPFESDDVSDFHPELVDKFLLKLADYYVRNQYKSFPHQILGRTNKTSA